MSGPDVGQEFSLPSGTSYIGRDRDVDIRLSDPMTSKRHARITVGETVEIVDTNSANGLIMDGLPVTRATLNSSDTVTLGDTTVSVVGLGHHGGAPTSPLVDFNRSPRVVPRFAPPKRVLPAGPKRQDHHPFPYIMLIAPLMMGAILFAVTGNVLSVLFMMMMPLFIIGHYVDHKMQSKRERKEQLKQFREAMAAFRKDITELQHIERSVRLQEAPSVSDTVDSIYKLGPLLWTHRPEHKGFLGLRFGLGTAPSRIAFEEPGNNETEAEYMQEIQACLKQFQDIEGVPIVSQLRSSGAFGLAGGARPGGRCSPRHGAADRGAAFPGRSGGHGNHLRPVQGTLELAPVAAPRRLRAQPAQRRPPRGRTGRRLLTAGPAGGPHRPTRSGRAVAASRAAARHRQRERRHPCPRPALRAGHRRRRRSR